MEPSPSTATCRNTHNPHLCAPALYMVASRAILSTHRESPRPARHLPRGQNRLRAASPSPICPACRTAAVVADNAAPQPAPCCPCNPSHRTPLKPAPKAQPTAAHLNRAPSSPGRHMASFPHHRLTPVPAVQLPQVRRGRPHPGPRPCPRRPARAAARHAQAASVRPRPRTASTAAR